MFICSPIGSYCAMRKTYSRCYRKHVVMFVLVNIRQDYAVFVWFRVYKLY